MTVGYLIKVGLVSVQIFGVLACLEEAENFVVVWLGGGGVGWGGGGVVDQVKFRIQL